MVCEQLPVIVSYTQSMQATFCHCLKFSFNVLKNILIGVLFCFVLIKKTNWRSCNGFHIVRFICLSRACTKSPHSPAGSEVCSTDPGSCPMGYGWRGTHCKIPVYPHFHWEYCFQVSRQSHTLNFKAKEVGKVSFLVSLSNEFIGTLFPHLNWDRYIHLPIPEPAFCIHGPSHGWGRTVVHALMLFDVYPLICRCSSV